MAARVIKHHHPRTVHATGTRRSVACMWQRRNASPNRPPSPSHQPLAPNRRLRTSCASLSPVVPFSDYEPFNRSNFDIRSKSWSYRGCWHQAGPLLASHENFYLSSIPLVKTKLLRPCYLRSLSHSFKYWIICAPAAFLKSERCISCVLSGVEP